MKEKIIKMIADEIGVEFGEVFCINGYDFQYKLEKDGLYYSHKDCERWNSLGIDTLLDKMDVVEKKKWIPKDGEECFVIQYDGIFYDEFEVDSISYVSKFILGGIYKTEKEAEARREEFIDRIDRIMKGELVVKFEEVEK